MNPNLAEALSRAQAVMGNALKDTKSHKHMYADMASVVAAIREPLATNGLAVSQIMRVQDNGSTLIRSILMHTSGEQIVSEMKLPDIADPKELGSCITYYRRYMLMAICGLAPHDDDGTAAVPAAIEAHAKQIGEREGEFVLKELDEFPDYQSEVIRYLERNKSSFGQMTRKDAAAIRGKIQRLKEAKNGKS